MNIKQSGKLGGKKEFCSPETEEDRKEEKNARTKRKIV